MLIGSVRSLGWGWLRRRRLAEDDPALAGDSLVLRLWLLYHLRCECDDESMRSWPTHIGCG